MFTSKSIEPPLSVKYLRTLAKILDFPANSHYMLKQLMRSLIIFDQETILKLLTSKNQDSYQEIREVKSSNSFGKTNFEARL